MFWLEYSNLEKTSDELRNLFFETDNHFFHYHEITEKIRVKKCQKFLRWLSNETNFATT